MPALEEVIAENTAVMRELISIMKTKPGSTTAPAPAADAGRRPPGRPRQVTLEEATAIAQKLAKEKTPPVAAKLIAKVGGGKLADMPKEKYAQFIAEAEVLLNAADEPEEAEDDVL